MNLRRILSALLLPALVACQALAPQSVSTEPAAQSDLRAEYQALAQGGAVYQVDPSASRVRIFVFRAGAAARLGHNHVLSAPTFEGYVSVPSDQASDARFELRVPLAELVVDDSEIRKETGGSFSGERSADDIAGTRRNMLGARGLSADQFPIVRLRSVAIEGDWPMLVAQLEVTLHGVTRTQAVMLHVERSAAQLRVDGEFTLRQSDFGVTPFSALGGLMKVQDAVAIRFALVATPTRTAP